jgi:hypothetical protein
VPILWRFCKKSKYWTFLFAYKLVELLGGNAKALKSGMLWDMVEEEKE